MFEQLPSHDIQAEESVIASLMVDEDASNKVAPILEPRDFFRQVGQACPLGDSLAIGVRNVSRSRRCG